MEDVEWDVATLACFLDRSAALGWVLVSERELQRVEVISQLDQGLATFEMAAHFPGISRRQVQRLLKLYRQSSASGLRHKARGRRSNNFTPLSTHAYALSLVKDRYADFGPAFAAGKLRDVHDIEVSRETLRKWMIEDGLWVSRKYRRKFHQPRLRRERVGELIQIDGPDHRWFEDRGDPCTVCSTRRPGGWQMSCAGTTSAMLVSN